MNKKRTKTAQHDEMKLFKESGKDWQKLQSNRIKKNNALPSRLTHENASLSVSQNDELERKRKSISREYRKRFKY